MIRKHPADAVSYRAAVPSTSLDKICTYYSRWTLDGLWMVKAPTIVSFQSRLWMDVYIVGGFS